MLDIRQHEIFDDINHQLDRLDRASPAGKILGQLIEALLKGQLEYDIVWDDLRSPAVSISPVPGFAADRDDDGSLLFDTTIVEQAATLKQMLHSWKLESYVIPHVHWGKTTDAAGDVEWEYRYRIINEGQIPPAWSSWIGATGRSQTIGADQTHIVDTFPELDMTGVELSAMISVQLRRNVDHEDDNYGADARLWEFDIHYQRDGLGSFEPWLKGTV